jgi:hypothetical protein
VELDNNRPVIAAPRRRKLICIIIPRHPLTLSAVKSGKSVTAPSCATHIGGLSYHWFPASTHELFGTVEKSNFLMADALPNPEDLMIWFPESEAIATNPSC